MAISYAVIPHQDGWAIIVTPAHAEAFATKNEAFAAAVDYARRLRCEGVTVEVHVKHLGLERVFVD